MSDEFIRDHQDEVTDAARPRGDDPPHSGPGSKSGGYPVPAAGSEDADKVRPRGDDPPHSGAGSKTGTYSADAG